MDNTTQVKTTKRQPDLKVEDNVDVIEYVPKKPQPGTTIRRGRPLKFESAVALQKKINAYFEYCDAVDKKTSKVQIPYTMSGLALFLGISRQTLLAYEGKEYYGYGNLIEEAKTKVENYAEKELFGTRTCVGAIFALKNNFAGWQEGQAVTVRGPLGSILDEVQKYARERGIIKGGGNLLTTAKEKER